MSDVKKWIRVANIEYEVLEQLSSIDRGRYLVWARNPRPSGTRYVALILEKGAATEQLYRAVSSIPPTISGIPKLKNHGYVDNNRVLIIDYLPGVTLDDILKKALAENHGESRTSAYEAIRLVRGFAHGIRFLHEELRLVHGDIKPENIVVSGKPWQLQLIDFGTCWRMSNLKDRVEGDGCSPQFGAPEMFSDDPIDHRVDQFSLGVILSLLLTGQLPYSGIATSLLLSSETTPPLLLPCKTYGWNHSELRKMPFALRDQIDGLVGKMLRVNPHERFSSTKQMVNELDSIWDYLRSADTASKVPTKHSSILDRIPRNWKTFIVDWLDKD